MPSPPGSPTRWPPATRRRDRRREQQRRQVGAGEHQEGRLVAAYAEQTLQKHMRLLLQDLGHEPELNIWGGQTPDTALTRDKHT